MGIKPKSFFPEIIPPTTPISDSDEASHLFSDFRSLDMYSEVRPICKGRHAIWAATYDGDPCVLKQFVCRTEMFREAKIQFRLRHQTIVPIIALFGVDGKHFLVL